MKNRAGLASVQIFNFHSCPLFKEARIVRVLKVVRVVRVLRWSACNYY